MPDNPKPCNVFLMMEAKRIKDDFKEGIDWLGLLMETVGNYAIGEIQKIVAAAIQKYIDNPLLMLSSILNEVSAICGSIEDGDWICFFLNKYVDDLRISARNELGTWSEIYNICKSMSNQPETENVGKSNIEESILGLLRTVEKLEKEYLAEQKGKNEAIKKHRILTKIKMNVRKAIHLLGGKTQQFSEKDWGSALLEASLDVGIDKITKGEKVGKRALYRTVQPRVNPILMKDIKSNKPQKNFETIYINLSKLSRILEKITGYNLNPALQQFEVIVNTPIIDYNSVLNGEPSTSKNSPIINTNKSIIKGDIINIDKTNESLNKIKNNLSDKNKRYDIKKIIGEATVSPKDHYATDNIYKTYHGASQEDVATQIAYTMSMINEYTSFNSTLNYDMKTYKVNLMAIQALSSIDINVASKAQDDNKSANSSMRTSIEDIIDNNLLNNNMKEILAKDTEVIPYKDIDKPKTVYDLNKYLREINDAEKLLVSSEMVSDNTSYNTKVREAVDELERLDTFVKDLGIYYVKDYRMLTDIVSIATKSILGIKNPVSKNALALIEMKVAYLQDRLNIINDIKPYRNIRVERLYAELQASGVSYVPLMMLGNQNPIFGKVLETINAVDNVMALINIILSATAGCKDKLDSGKLEYKLMKGMGYVITYVNGYIISEIFHLAKSIADTLLNAIGMSYEWIMYKKSQLDELSAGDENTKALREAINNMMNQIEGAVDKFAGLTEFNTVYTGIGEANISDDLKLSFPRTYKAWIDNTYIKKEQ